VVIVDFGRGLAVVRAQDPPGVLEQASLAGDGRGEEQGAQRRAVEPFSRVGPGSHGEQRRAARLGDKPGERGSTVFGAPGRGRHAHAAAASAS
jgi:hypothetical protein